MVAGTQFLSRHKEGLTWCHIAIVVGTICLVVPAIARTGELPFSLARAAAIFLLGTIAWCQNIGLIHHLAHRLPRAPGRIGLYVARFLHSLGGLSYTSASFAHRLHHAYLGTDLDPDRLGYQSTATLGRRLRYVFLIGPLRARFAPVDTSRALQAMSADRRAEHERLARLDRRLIAATHLVLMGLCGLYYLVVFAALLSANVLSNMREMAEHGRNGHGAYVDIKVSPLGVLLFSTPGFWFHGIHHMDAGIHYLDLPLASRTFAAKGDLPYLRRASALGYLFTGR